MSLDRSSFLIGALSALLACGPVRAILTPMEASADDDDSASSDTRVAELEQRVEDLEGVLAAALLAMDQAEVNALAAQARVTELEGQVDAIEVRLATLEAWQSTFDAMWTAEDLPARVVALEGVVYAP